MGRRDCCLIETAPPRRRLLNIQAPAQAKAGSALFGEITLKVKLLKERVFKTKIEN